MKYLKVVFVINAIALLYGCSRTPDVELHDERVVLQVNDQILPLGDLEKLAQKSVFTDAKREYEIKKAIVNKCLERFLLLEGIKESGLTAELDSSLIKRSLLRLYSNVKAGEKLEITESEAWSFAERHGGRIQAGHLLVSDRGLADSLYEALVRGADFEALVREFSKDRTTADKGGTLGYTQYGQLGTEFEEAAYALKIGEFSRPVLTRFGWHIIKLYDKIGIKEGEFEQQKGHFIDLVRRNADRAAQKNFREEVKKKFHYEVISPVLDLLAHKADSARALGILPAGLPSSVYLDASLFTDAEKETYVVKHDVGGLKIIDLLGYIRGFAPERAPDVKERVIMESLFDEILLGTLVEQMALEEGFDKDPRFLAELDYLRSSILEQKMRERISGMAEPVTEDNIVNYYNEHAGEFYFPDRIRASAIVVKTRQEAEELLQRVKNGALFHQLALKYSLDKRSGAVGGDLNYFSIKMYTPIYEAAESLQIGDVGGPLEYDNNCWIFKLTDRIAAGPKRFDLVKADLQSKLSVDRQQQAYDDFISTMKEKIQFKMDLELVKNNLRMGEYREPEEPKG